MVKEDPLGNKSYDFALQIINTVQKIQRENREYVLTKQLLRSGTAIGALVREAVFAQSRADFSHKMSISLKEANESTYWLSLMKDSGYLKVTEFQPLSDACRELIAILVATVKKTKA